MKLAEKKQGVAVRLAATQVLGTIFDKGLTLDEALDKIDAKHRLPVQDRRLVHAICGFVFRNLNTIDPIIYTLMNRKRPPSPRLLHQLLRVGVAQLLFMDVADHAAVDTCVSATGALHLSKQKSLVNAVLRNVIRKKNDLITPANQASSWVPSWLAKRWAKHYGDARATNLIQCMRSEAPIDVTLKDVKASLEWAHDLGGEPLIDGHVRVRAPKGHVSAWAGFDEGAWWVQDLAASLPINSLGDIAGKRVIDLCAAPGGKSMQLAAKGAWVTALDVSEARLERITENANRIFGADAPNHVQTLCADATQYVPQDLFDIVVLDAPCSASGTLRRHPEHPWIHSEKSIERCTLTQSALLDHALKMLKNDGILLYCTCSLEPEEGEMQLEAFLQKHKDFKEIKDVPDAIHALVERGKDDLGFRTYPDTLADKGGMDGFFFAKLQKQ